MATYKQCKTFIYAHGKIGTSSIIRTNPTAFNASLLRRQRVFSDIIGIKSANCVTKNEYIITAVTHGAMQENSCNQELGSERTF